MVFGIINCVLFVFIMFQSCVTTVATSLQESEDTSGAVGMLFAFLLLGAGIAAIVTRNNTNKLPNWIIGVIYGIACWVAKSGSKGMYKDLQVWSIWAGICALQVLFTYAFAELKKQKETPPAVPRQPQQPQKPQSKYQGAPKGSISSIAHAKLDNK
jgi:hypothetical protein